MILIGYTNMIKTGTGYQRHIKNLFDGLPFMLYNRVKENKLMNTLPIGIMTFNGVLLDASFIGRKYIKDRYYSCYQPYFGECTLVRCEPDDGTNVLFIKGEEF